jgi:hypothetical protein
MKARVGGAGFAGWRERAAAPGRALRLISSATAAVLCALLMVAKGAANLGARSRPARRRRADALNPSGAGV